VFPGGGTPDMQQLLQQAQQMQQQLMDAQERLAQTKVEGSAGGGLVTATVTGTGELTGLTIDPQAVDPDDTETLADLILAAVRDATNNANDLQAQTMGPLAGALGGMGGPDLSGPGGLPGLPGQ
jgi:nucleoid-associated protein EbfC